MDELAKTHFKQSMMKNDSSPFRSNGPTDIPIGRSTVMCESYVESDRQGVSNDLKIEMENIYQKKLNEELEQEKFHLVDSLKKLESSTKANHETNIALQNQLSDLKEKIKAKEREDRDQKGMFTRFQKTLESMSSELAQKDRTIRQLELKVEKLS